MRIVFMGSPDFAVPALDALTRMHEVVCVYAQPPRPGGRGHKERPCPVHAKAQDLGLAVRTPARLRDPAEQDAFAALEADAAVVAAYGLILPPPLLDAPRLGCLNIHASLLPRWRGAAPIHRALLAGDRETGITIMRMDAGLDTGPILLREAVPIGPRTDLGTLHDQLAGLGADLILKALDGVASARLPPVPQPEEGVTYAPKIDPKERKIDWSRTAGEVDRQIRAFAPVPGAWFPCRGERVKVLKAAVAEPGSKVHGSAGEVLDDRLTVACGGGALSLLRLQRGGRKPMDSLSFLRGFPVPAGTRLE